MLISIMSRDIYTVGGWGVGDGYVFGCSFFLRVPTDQGNQGKQGKFLQLFPVREIREKHAVLIQNQGKNFKSGKF